MDCMDSPDKPQFIGLKPMVQEVLALHSQHLPTVCVVANKNRG